MKNPQNGFVGIVIVVVIALLVVVGGTYVTLPKNIAVESVATYGNEESVSQSGYSTNQSPTGYVTEGQGINEITKSDQGVLTDSDILNATYNISANFDGVKSPSVAIIFPRATSGNRLSGTVYVNKSGTIVNSTSENPEAFWIESYKYTDSSHTEAKVFIGGNFGASGYDDRAFFVSKVNGVVTTKETTCNKTSNGRCGDDSKTTILDNSKTPSGWLTYKDSTYGFEVNYPSGYDKPGTTSISLSILSGMKTGNISFDNFMKGQVVVSGCGDTKDKCGYLRTYKTFTVAGKRGASIESVGWPSRVPAIETVIELDSKNTLSIFIYGGGTEISKADIDSGVFSGFKYLEDLNDSIIATFKVAK